MDQNTSYLFDSLPVGIDYTNLHSHNMSIFNLKFSVYKYIYKIRYQTMYKIVYLPMRYLYPIGSEFKIEKAIPRG